MRVTRHLLSGCECSPPLGKLGVLKGAPPVYLFYLDTQNFGNSPGGPYSYMAVPFTYYGQIAIPMPNAPPDSTVLDRANAGAAAGSILVRWYDRQVAPGALYSFSNADSGNASINAANAAGLSKNITYSAPPTDVFLQAAALAANVGEPILIGVIQQDTSSFAFQQHNSPQGRSNVAPVVSQRSAPLNVSAPIQSNVIPESVAQANQNAAVGPSLLVGTQNPPGFTTSVANVGGLSLTEIAILVGIAALLIL
jgi:hypothetical protein